MKALSEYEKEMIYITKYNIKKDDLVKLNKIILKGLSPLVILVGFFATLYYVTHEDNQESYITPQNVQTNYQKIPERGKTILDSIYQVKAGIDSFYQKKIDSLEQVFENKLEREIKKEETKRK